MDYEAPENFIKFKHGWYQGIDFDKEAELLGTELDNEKETDIQRYIKGNKNDLYHYLKGMVLGIMKCLLRQNIC